jgi:hypothetical protein
MKKAWLLIRVLCCIMFCSQQAAAQKDTMPLISIHLDSAGIEQMVLALERQTSLHFYYDRSQFDSFFVTILAEKQPLMKVLEEAFDQTDFQFFLQKTSPSAQAFLLY